MGRRQFTVHAEQIPCCQLTALNASVIQCLQGIKERARYRYVGKGIDSSGPQCVLDETATVTARQDVIATGICLSHINVGLDFRILLRRCLDRTASLELLGCVPAYIPNYNSVVEGPSLMDRIETNGVSRVDADSDVVCAIATAPSRERHVKAERID
jgi:hypothetical protein